VYYPHFRKHSLQPYRYYHRHRILHTMAHHFGLMVQPDNRGRKFEGLFQQSDFHEWFLCKIIKLLEKYLIKYNLYIPCMFFIWRVRADLRLNVEIHIVHEKRTPSCFFWCLIKLSFRVKDAEHVSQLNIMKIL